MLNIINSLIWYVVIIVIIYVGIKLSFRLKYIQFRFIKMIKNIINIDGNNSLSALFLSLAGKIGVGSIAGVALAIYIGGVGTIFWIFIFTFLLAIITYTETYLGLKYQVKNDQEYEGGPSYYIKYGLKNNCLADIYSILIIIAYTFGFISIQSNTIGKMFLYVGDVNLTIIGLVLALLVLIIVMKGINLITRITNILVPLMLILYILIALYLVFININVIPSLVKEIISSSLNLKPFITGFLYQVIIGVERCEFASEAGLGTGAISASISNSNPASQGFIQMFGIYITNILVCLSSAIIIMLSPYQNIKFHNINGIELSIFSFNYHFGYKGVIILLILICFFSFSTILTCFYYSSVSIKFLFKKYSKEVIIILKFIMAIMTFFGIFFNSKNLWLIVDILVGIFALINIYSIYKLKNEVR